MAFLEPVKEIPTLKSAQVAISKKYGPGDLSEGAKLACWLILEKNRPLTTAKRAAKNKYGVSMSAVERAVKEVIPDHFFSDRSKYGTPRGSRTIQEIANTATKHMQSMKKDS